MKMVSALSGPSDRREEREKMEEVILYVRILWKHVWIINSGW